MPYNRAKGRTSEIPPSPSAGRSRSISSVTPAATAAAEAASLFDPRQVDAQLEAQLSAARRPTSSSTSSGGGGGSRRAEGWRRWLFWLLLLPVELVTVLVLRPIAYTVEFVRETPAVVPAVVAMLFLYVGLPLLIAEDYL